MPSKKYAEATVSLVVLREAVVITLFILCIVSPVVAIADNAKSLTIEADSHQKKKRALNSEGGRV